MSGGVASNLIFYYRFCYTGTYFALCLSGILHVFECLFPSGGGDASLVVLWYHETSFGEARPLKFTPMQASEKIKMRALLN